jgi:hypothetical protein
LSLKIDGHGTILPEDVAQMLEDPNLSKLISLQLSSVDINLSTLTVFKAIASLQDLKIFYFAHGKIP